MTPLQPQNRAAGHPIDVVPPVNVASPGELQHPPEGDGMRFWKPTWGEICRNMGWRWIFFIPLAGLLAAIIMIPWLPSLVQFLLYGGWKLMTFAVALSLGLAASATRRLVQRRTEPFCIHCGYDLTGLADGSICPECGRTFQHRIIDEYRRDPHWFIQRYRKHQTKQIVTSEFRIEAGPNRRPKSRDGT